MRAIMKTKIILPIAVVLTIAALMAGYVQMSQERKSEAGDDAPIAAESRIKTASSGQTVITLDSRAQELIGLQTATLTNTERLPGIKGYGRVLDAAALVGLHGETVAARAALQAAQQEYERLKTLSAQANASARTLESAEAARSRAQSLLATAEAQLVAVTGKVVAGETPGFFRALASQENVLVRLDLPAGEMAAATPVAALIFLPGQQPPITAEFLDRAATTGPQVQGMGFLFLVKRAPASLAPGLAVAGFLQLPGEPAGGVIVPNNAVVRSDGRAWIYTQTSKTNFTRREIFLDQPATDGWFLTNGLTAGDRVVITGAQTLLSEERKQDIQMGD